MDYATYHLLGEPETTIDVPIRYTYDPLPIAPSKKKQVVRLDQETLG